MWLEPWSTLMVELLTTVVVPPVLNGAGWLTFLSSLIVTDSEPCDTAAGLTVTLLLMTTVPVRELMMTRAGALAGSTCRFSTLDRNAIRSVGSCGAATRIEPPSRIVAVPGATPALTLSASRVAVVKSGLLRFRMIASPCARLDGTAFSTVAPFGMRPELGTLTVSFEPSAASAPKPLTIRLPCAIA